MLSLKICFKYVNVNINIRFGTKLYGYIFGIDGKRVLLVTDLFFSSWFLFLMINKMQLLKDLKLHLVILMIF